MANLSSFILAPPTAANFQVPLKEGTYTMTNHTTSETKTFVVSNGGQDLTIENTDGVNYVLNWTSHFANTNVLAGDGTDNGYYWVSDNGTNNNLTINQTIGNLELALDIGYDGKMPWKNPGNNPSVSITDGVLAGAANASGDPFVTPMLQ